ncbi:uncharacterized protein [Clytia hemisphaerica]|uniref:uncharacterized protein n=1 Tax=Clytia hemisphaerica TaxID=252671 RepID=UPI0034D60169
MMDFHILPNELLEMVISYLDKKTTKNLNLASKRMYELTMERLWCKPTYKDPKSLSFLKQISHFPIRELRIQDFECEWEDIVETVPNLKLLHIDCDRNKYWSPKSLLRLKTPLVVHTRALEIRSDAEFEPLLEVVEAGYITKLIVNHDKMMRQWSVELLRKLVGKVHVSEINTPCFRFTRKNVEEFCEIISSLKNCLVCFPLKKRTEDHDHDEDEISAEGDRFRAYKFTSDDIETFARYDIKISYMSSSMLKYQKDLSNLVDFVPALRRLLYLRCFEFQESGLKLDHRTFEHFVDIPIRSIKTNLLKMNKDNVGDFVDALSKIKTLQHIHMVWNGFKLTPEDFALFKNLPVKKIRFFALDLTRENVPKFRQIMSEMKIERLGAMTNEKKKTLGIRFHQFGPGYWSI